MKPYYLILITITLTFLLEGCLDIDIQTIISPDGSCDRIITVRRDTESLPPAAFPIPTDTTWTIEWKKTGKDSPKYEYIARKHFKNPEELSTEYSSRPDTSLLQISVNIKNSFEWFYTYIKYDETYKIDNPFLKIPITNVLSEEEIDKYRRGEKDDSIKTIIDRWYMRNIFEDFFEDALICIENKKDPALPGTLFKEKKEILYSNLMNDSGPSNIDALLKILEKIIKTKAVFSLRNDLDRIWKGIEKKSERLSTADGNYTNSVGLPGIVISTNSNNIEGSRITWKFTSDQLRIGEFKMSAESRVTNLWAFILTGIIIFVILLIIILRVRRF